MLIPRFTLRWLLTLMTVSSFFFLILAFAVRGQAWAIAVSVGVGSLFLAFLAYAFVFFVAAVVSGTMRLLQPGAAPSSMPFATAEPPAQIIPPKEPE